MRNHRKGAVLEALARSSTAMTAAELACEMRLPYPVRGLYPHLADYAHWGLILRWRGASGRLLFRIADRGRARLAWLRRRGEG